MPLDAERPDADVPRTRPPAEGDGADCVGDGDPKECEFEVDCEVQETQEIPDLWDDYGVLKPPRAFLAWRRSTDDRLARLADLVTACGSVTHASAAADLGPQVDTLEPVARILRLCAQEAGRVLRFEHRLEPEQS